jgi:DNA-binding transcriptional MerR regulator
MESGMKAKEARAQGLLSVGEAAQQLQTTPRTLLYYEEEGLVAPRRSDRGTRFYSAFDLRRLEMCLRLARLDIPIRTIRELTQTRRAAGTGDEAARTVAAVLAEIRHQSRTRIATLRALVRDLDRAEESLSRCAGCPRLPTRSGCPTCPCEREDPDTDVLTLITDPHPRS